jgi:hypothetical protein
MEPSERGDATRPGLLSQAAHRSRELHESLNAHEADLLRHIVSADTSAGLHHEPDATTLREGADRLRRAIDAASRLIEGLASALTDEDGR